MKIILQKPDTVGALASTLCLLHCIATPLLFIVHSCAAGGCASSPFWWKSLDFVFLAISLIAVKRSTQNTSKPFMKPLLWISWSCLFFLIINERLLWVSFPESLMHISAVSLAVLHIYNLKYCLCKTDKCCTNSI
ncbi:MerC domain-containing protein [Gaetbulibacter jejuensis]|uniref:MerC domain-containing protein n=1 Tax=Gaetbulibacter jejuensis TaxID=584607 RepID=UPI003008B7A3